MRAWAAPVVDGIRQDQQEVELEAQGLILLPHSLPWASVAYRYEYEPGEDIPVMPLMTRRTVTEVEIEPEEPRWLAWLNRTFGGRR